MSGKTSSSPSRTTPSLSTGPAATVRPGAAAPGNAREVRERHAERDAEHERRQVGETARWARERYRDPDPREREAGRRARSFVRLQERVAVVRRRHERLLDRARADPADQVPHRAGLVVRPRGARAAEGLLPDDGARRLVVDVEVAGRVAERLVGLVERVAIVREDGAGERVRARRVDEVERVRPLRLVVDVRRDDRAEELVAQEPEVRGRRS